MSNESRSTTESGPASKQVEIGVACFIGVFGLIIIAGSLQVGINWGLEGPKAGFFPFYVGLLIVIASIVNLARAVIDGIPGKMFASWEQLRQVLAVVVPTAIYVIVIPLIGIYVASAILIAAFMKWLGRYRWGLVIAVALGIPIIFYFMFERWFLVPLPKGPLEELLGL